MADSDRFYLSAAWIWVVGFALFRLSYTGLFLLVPDETNYWQWSRHLAWGYHDQAPLIAWAIRVSTGLIGHTETGVRLPSVLALTIASAYLLCIARRYIDARAAWSTAILTQAVLEFNVGGLLATPDGLQAAAWAGASYHVARAYEENQWSQWLMGGIWFGMGMLGKYTMVLFLPCAFLYGLLMEMHRPRLKGPRPYAGLFVGLTMFLPVVLWNADHGWNSVRHVAYLGGANDAVSIHLRYFGDFIASQAGLLSPLLFVLGLSAWFLVLQKPPRTSHWIYSYFFFTSFPVFGFFTLLSLHTRVYGNWPAAGYLTASVLIAAFFAKNRPSPPSTRFLQYGRTLWPWAIGSAYLFSALLLLHVAWPVLPIPATLDRTARETTGWDLLGKKAAEVIGTMPNSNKTFLFGLRYQIASELAFYTPGQPDTVSINRWKRPNVYDYWWRDEDLIGWDAVGVTYRPDSHLTKLSQVFRRVEPPLRLDIHKTPVFHRFGANTGPIKTFYLYRAYGFKGGLRWNPPNSRDIRAR